MSREKQIQYVVTLNQGQLMYLKAVIRIFDVLLDSTNKETHIGIQLELEAAQQIDQTECPDIIPIRKE